MTDTVGFINKLPHHLIDAFRSTLEEARYADYILHVVDTSNPQMELQMQVVYDTLRELKVEDKKIVTLLNKQDKLLAPMVVKDLKSIRDYIAEDNEEYATRTIKEIYDKIENLQMFPGIGSNLSKRVSFRTDYKYAIWEDYIIIYKVDNKYIEIYRVINRYQDITRIFD